MLFGLLSNKSHFLSFEGGFSDLEGDIALLQRSNPSSLDVTVKPDGSFQLEKRGYSSRFFDFVVSIISVFNRHISAYYFRSARMKAYSDAAQRIFQTSFSFNREQIQRFYFNGLRKWSIDSFDRSALSEKVQDLLVPELKKARNFKNPNDDEKMRFALMRVYLALNLGLSPKRNSGGATDSQKYFDHTGEVVGVFKQANVQPGVIKRTQSAVRSIFFRRQTGLSISGGGHIEEGTVLANSEVATSIADRFLNIGLTPVTRSVQIGSKIGSFQLWRGEHVVDAQDFTWSDNPTEQELSRFQRMVIFDYLIGNLDRHMRNWLVYSKNQSTLQDIVLVDNANSFPSENPDETIRDLLVRRKMYAWRSHPWARVPFTPSSFSLIDKITEKDTLDNCIAVINAFIHMNGIASPLFLDAQKVAKMKERAQILKKVQKEELVPLALGLLQTDQRISSFTRPAEKLKKII